MEIKNTHQIWSLFQEDDARDKENWINVNSLSKWLDDNKELLFTREEGDLSEEKRLMIWASKLLCELEKHD